MELKEFIENFANQFDETDASEIHADTCFQDLDEWSSMAAMGIIAMAKVSYGKIVTGKEIRSCKTVQELFDLINSK